MKRTYFIILIELLLCDSMISCGLKERELPDRTKENNKTMASKTNIKQDTIVLGGGCFWCMEAIYQRLQGVTSVQSGYSGGTVKNPTYEEVCTGTTGHAESVQIVYNENEISLAEILKVFFKTHDPTTLNRQGNDVGTQYRSVIFYRNEEQHQVAETIKDGLNKSGAYNSPIVTQIVPFTVFYDAEKYHDNYFNEHRNSNPYCQFVIVPKLEKFEHYFSDKIKR